MAKAKKKTTKKPAKKKTARAIGRAKIKFTKPKEPANPEAAHFTSPNYNQQEMRVHADSVEVLSREQEVHGLQETVKHLDAKIAELKKTPAWLVTLSNEVGPLGMWFMTGPDPRHHEEWHVLTNLVKYPPWTFNIQEVGILTIEGLRVQVAQAIKKDSEEAGELLEKLEPTTLGQAMSDLHTAIVEEDSDGEFYRRD